MKNALWPRHFVARAFVQLRVVALLMLVTSIAFAQDARVDTIRKIVEAQGMKEMFDDSLAQSREAATKMGLELYQKSVASGEVPASAQHKESFDRYMKAAVALFTSDEIIAHWSTLYGKSLTLAELKSILAYYQSPTGRKEVAATKIAMQQLMVWFAAQTQLRLEKLLETLTRDLNASNKPCENKAKSIVSGAESECT